MPYIYRNTFLLCSIITVFLLWIINSLIKSDNIERFISDKPDDIDKVVNFVHKEITTGNDSRNWVLYKAEKDDNYYRLYKDNSVVYSVRVDIDNNKKRYRVFTGINPVGTDVIEIEKDGSEYEGQHSGMTNRISVNHGRTRVVIRLRNNQIVIKGLGGFAGYNSLPHPWYYGVPIVWTEGGRAVGLMENDKDSSDKYSVVISVPEDQIKYIPVFLQAYAILHETISKRDL